jgi:hypothetical protein
MSNINKFVYSVEFDFTVANLRNGINFQGKRGEIKVALDEPSDFTDADNLKELGLLVYGGLQSQLQRDEYLIANKFTITKVELIP